MGDDSSTRNMSFRTPVFWRSSWVSGIPGVPITSSRGHAADDEQLRYLSPPLNMQVTQTNAVPGPLLLGGQLVPIEPSSIGQYACTNPMTSSIPTLNYSFQAGYVSTQMGSRQCHQNTSPGNHHNTVAQEHSQHMAAAVQPDNVPSQLSVITEGSRSKAGIVNKKNNGAKSLTSTQEENDEIASISTSPKYNKRLQSLEDRFFQILKEFGDRGLQQLCEYETWCHNNGSNRKDHRFYLVLEGKQETFKTEILNKALIVFCANVTNQKSPHQPLEKCTIADIVLNLFILFRRKGIEYDADDFHSTSDFLAAKGYNRLQELESRFFNLLQHCGDERLQQLCEYETWGHDGLNQEDRRFYKILAGTKEPFKFELMKQAVFVFRTKVTNKRYPQKPLDELTVEQIIKKLFKIFRQKGVEYLADDFKDPTTRLQPPLGANVCDVKQKPNGQESFRSLKSDKKQKNGNNVDKLKRERKDHLNELKSHKIKVKQLSDQVESVNHDNARIRKEYGNLQGEYNDVQRKLKHLRDAYDDAEREIKRLKKSQAQEKTRLYDHENTLLEAVNSEKNASAQGITQLQIELNKMKGRVVSLEKEKTYFEEHNAKTEAAMKRKESEVSEVEESLSKQGVIIDYLEKELAKKDRIVESLGNKTCSNEVTIVALRQELNETKQRLDEYTHYNRSNNCVIM